MLFTAAYASLYVLFTAVYLSLHVLFTAVYLELQSQVGAKNDLRTQDNCNLKSSASCSAHFLNLLLIEIIKTRLVTQGPCNGKWRRPGSVPAVGNPGSVPVVGNPGSVPA